MKFHRQGVIALVAAVVSASASSSGTTFFIDPKQQLIIIMMVQVPFSTVTFYRNKVRYLAYQALSAPD